MKIFIAGGTGVLGRPVVRLLAEAGHDVRALTRSPDRATAVAAAGATPVAADLFDEDSVVAAAQGADAVINLATKIPPLRRAAVPSSWAENDRIRSTGSTNLASAAIAVGAERFLQESIVLLYASGGDQWLDEDSPIVANPRVESLLVAEHQVTRVAEHGLVGVALRFGLFHGPDGAQAREMAALLRRGICPSLGGPNDFVPAIAVADAATAVVAALTVPAGIYNITDDEPLRRRDYCKALCVGVGRTSALLPPRVAGRTKSTRHIAQSLRVSNDRFKQVSGWQPALPSVRESWADAVARMDQAADLTAARTAP